MLKRTTGRLLLTLLVITGLAGTLSNSSLSQKERKQAISLIKSSRYEIAKSTNGLSQKQFDYRPSSQDPSIGDLVMNLAALEKASIADIKSVMNRPANEENRLKIALTDQQLLASDFFVTGQTLSNSESSMYPKNPADALKKFFAMRDHQIKYIRTSTEDFRNHVVQTQAGWIDCYQYFLLVADQSNYFAEKINEIKNSSGFPKK